MQIQQERFLDFLGRDSVRFVIPVFQRVYSWDARQCEELWDDVMRTGAPGDDALHFMGLVLYAKDADSWQGAEQLDIIDGQQRMTTLSLLLCALARYLDDNAASLPGVQAGDLFERYLRVGKAGKLSLSSMDRDTLFALVGAGVMPEEPAGRLVENLELFFGKMQEEGFDAATLWRGLQKLEVASVLLAHDDSPQLVFESLNSKGMALTLADRIRNYIVVTDDAKGGSELYERSWLPLEEQVAAYGIFDVTDAFNAWLAGKYRSVRIFDESEVYGVFKTCLRTEYDGDLVPLLAQVSSYAKSLKQNDGFRAKELENAERWIAGKPKDLISEYKMFGD